MTVHPEGCQSTGRSVHGGGSGRSTVWSPLPVVDLVTGRCKPGNVSRTIARSPLMLDLTVVCTTSAVVPPPGASSDTIVPPAAVSNDEIDVGTSVPVITAPALVVEQPSTSGEGGGPCR